MPQNTDDIKKLQGLDGEPKKTKAEVDAMSFEERLKFSKENPGAIQQIYNTVSPAETQTGIGGLQELNKYDEGLVLNDYLGSQQFHRAKEQKPIDEFGNAVARLTNIVPSVIGNVASALDFEDYLNQDGEMGNEITRAMERIKQSRNETYPIYKQNPGKPLDVGDSAWWFENGGSLVESAAAFAITGAGIGGATSKSLNWLSKAINAGKTGEQVAAGLAWGANTLALNQAEAMSSATQVYDQVYKDELEILQSASGDGSFTPEYLTQIDEMAKQKASEAAATTVNWNRANIVLNLTSAGAFIRNPNMVKFLPKPKTGLQRLGQVTGEGVQESLEEAVNFMAEKAGNAKGRGERYTLTEGLSDLMSEEGLEAMLLGAIGGIAQTGATDLTQFKSRRRERAEYEKQSMFSEVYKENINKYASTILNADEQAKIYQKMDKALETNDTEAYNQLQDQLLSTQAKHSFETGSESALLNTLQSLSEMTTEQAQEKGYDVDPDSPHYYKKKAKEAIQDVKEYKRLYTLTRGNNKLEQFNHLAGTYTTDKEIKSKREQIQESRDEMSDASVIAYPYAQEVIADPTVLFDLDKYKNLYYNSATYKTPKQVERDFKEFQELTAHEQDRIKKLEKRVRSLQKQKINYRKKYLDALENADKEVETPVETLKKEIEKKKEPKEEQAIPEVQQQTNDILNNKTPENDDGEIIARPPGAIRRSNKTEIPKKEDDTSKPDPNLVDRSKTLTQREVEGDGKDFSFDEPVAREPKAFRRTSRVENQAESEVNDEVENETPFEPIVQPEPEKVEYNLFGKPDGKTVIHHPNYFNTPYITGKEINPDILADITDDADPLSNMRISVEYFTNAELKEIYPKSDGKPYLQTGKNGIYQKAANHHIMLHYNNQPVAYIPNPYQFTDSKGDVLNMHDPIVLNRINPSFSDGKVVTERGKEFIDNYVSAKAVWDQLVNDTSGSKQAIYEASAYIDWNVLVEHQFLSANERLFLSDYSNYTSTYIDKFDNEITGTIIVDLNQDLIYAIDEFGDVVKNDEGENLIIESDEDLIARYKAAKVADFPKGKWAVLVNNKLIPLAYPDSMSMQIEIDEEFVAWRDSYMKPNMTRDEINEANNNSPRIFIATDGNQFSVDPEIDKTSKGIPTLKFVISRRQKRYAQFVIPSKTDHSKIKTFNQYIASINAGIQNAKIARDKGFELSQNQQRLAKLADDNFKVTQAYLRPVTDTGHKYVPKPNEVQPISRITTLPLIKHKESAPDFVESENEPTIIEKEEIIEPSNIDSKGSETPSKSFSFRLGSITSLSDLEALQEEYKGLSIDDQIKYASLLSDKESELTNKEKPSNDSFVFSMNKVDPQDRISKEDAIDRLSKLINLDDISVKNIEDLLTNVQNKGLTLGAVSNYAIWLSNSLDRGVVDHEAFHVVFRHYLTDPEISKYLSIADKHVNTGRKGIQSMRESSSTYTNLNDEQIKNIIREEWLANEFQAYMKDKRSKNILTILKRLFKKLVKMLGFTKENSHILGNFFNDIAGGKFVDQIIVHNVYRLSNIPNYKLLKAANKVVNGKVNNTFIDPETGEKIINTIAQRVAMNNLGVYSKESVQNEINKLVNFYSASNFSNELKALSQPIASEKIEEINNVRSALQLNENIETINKEVKRRMSLFIPISEDEEVENQEDVGAESWMLDNTQMGGFKGLSSFMRQYIAFTTIPTDQFGLSISPDRLKEEGFQFAVNPYEVYNYMERVLADTPRESRLYILSTIAKDNPQVNAFYKDLKQRLNYDPNEGLTRSIRNNPLYNKFLSAFEKTKLTQMMVTYDLYKGEMKVFESNRNDAGRTQVIRWSTDQGSKLSTGVITNEDIVTNLREIYKLMSGKAKNVYPENIDDTTDKINTLFREIGIQLSPAYIKWSLIDMNLNTLKRTDLFDENQQAIIQSDLLSFHAAYNIEGMDVKNFNKANKQGTANNIGIMGQSVKDGANMFEKVINTESDDVLESSIGRLTAIAKVNALFDESLSESTYTNSENKIIYDKVNPSFYSDEIAKWRNPARHKFNSLSEFRKAWPELDEFEAKRTFELLRDNILLQNEDLFDHNFRLKAIDGIRQEDSTGRSFGSLDIRSKILIKLGLFQKRSKVNDLERAYYEIGVNETANTSYIVELPVEKYYSNGSLTETGKSHLKNALKQEYNRIRRESRDFGKEGEIKVKGYNDFKHKKDKNGNDIYGRAFEFFNFLFLSETHPNLYKRMQDSAMADEEFDGKFDEDIDKVIDEISEIMLDGFVDLLKKPDIKIIEENDGYFLLPQDYRQGQKFDRNELGQFYFNDYLNSLYMSQLMDGDQAIGHKYSKFGVTEDGNLSYQISKSPGIEVVKRNKGKLAAGPPFGDGKSRGAIISIPEYLLSDSNEKYLHRWSADRTDAQSWNDLDFTLLYLQSQGKWSSEVKSVYSKIRRGDKLTKEDLKILDANQAHIPSRKFVYRDRGSYFKLSMATLTRGITSTWIGTKEQKKELYDKLDELIDKYGHQSQQVVFQKMKIQQKWKAQAGREWLHQMLNEMEQKQIDYVMAESASKMASRDVTEGLGGMIAHEYSNANWREQVKTDGVKSESVDGTQKMALVWSEQKSDAKSMFRGKATNMGKISDTYLEMLGLRTRMGLEKMRKKIIDEQGQAKYEDLVKSFMDSIEASGGDQYIAELLNPGPDGKPEYNMNITAVEQKVQSMFLSYVSKGVLKHKAPGSKLTLLSDQGFNVKRRDIDLPIVSNDIPFNYGNNKQLILNGDKTITSRNFKFIKNLNSGESGIQIIDGIRFKVTYHGELKHSEVESKTGINYSEGEAFAKTTKGEPTENATKQFIKGVGTKHIYQLEKITEEYTRLKHRVFDEATGQYFSECILTEALAKKLGLKKGDKLMGVRIPTQDKHSMINLKIVDFLPTEYGNTGIFPAEIVTLSGADFDIDSLYVRAFARKGNVVYGDYLNDNNYMEAAYAEYKAENGNIEWSDFIGKYGKQIKENVKQFKKGDFDKIKPITIGEVNNHLLTLEFSLVHNEGNKEIAATPATMTVLEDFIKVGEELGILPKETTRGVHAPDDKILAAQANDAGKAGIGPVALFNTLFQLLNRFNIEGGVEFPTGTRNFSSFSSNVSNIKDGSIKTHRTNDVISAILSAMTDNAKVRLASRLNLTTETLGPVLTMIGKGVDPSFAFLILKQPVVEKYIQELTLSKSAIKGPKEKRPQIKTREIDTSLTIEDLKNALSNKDDELSSEVGREALNIFAHAMRESEALAPITKIMQLSKGLNSTFSENDIRGYLNDLGILASFDEDGELILHQLDRPVTFNVVDALSNFSPSYNNIRAALQIEKDSAKFFISQTREFKNIIEAIRENVDEFKYSKNIREIETDLLSYIGLKAFFKEAKNRRDSYVKPDISILTSTQLTDRFNELKQDPNISKNKLLNYLKTEKVDQHYFIYANSFSKLSAQRQASLMNAYQELMIYDQEFAINLFNYLIVKDNLQFRNNSFIRQLQPAIFKLYSVALDNVQTAIDQNNFYDYMEMSEQDFGNEFYDMFARSELGSETNKATRVSFLKGTIQVGLLDSSKREIALWKGQNIEDVKTGNYYSITYGNASSEAQMNFKNNLYKLPFEVFEDPKTKLESVVFPKYFTLKQEGQIQIYKRILIDGNVDNYIDPTFNDSAIYEKVSKIGNKHIKPYALSTENTIENAPSLDELVEMNQKQLAAVDKPVETNKSKIKEESDVYDVIAREPGGFRRLGKKTDVSPAMIELLDKLKSKFGVDYIIDEKLDVVGRFKDGKVYINPKLATTETVFHEFAHPFVRAIRTTNPDLMNNLYKQIRGSNDGRLILQSVKDKYPDLDTKDQIEEAIVQAIGKLANQSQSQSTLWEWIRKAVEAIRKFLQSLKDDPSITINPAELDPNTTLRNLAIIMNLDNKVVLSASDLAISFDQRIPSDKQNKVKFTLDNLASQVKRKDGKFIVNGEQYKHTTSIVDNVYSDHKYIKDGRESEFQDNKNWQTILRQAMLSAANGTNLDTFVDNFLEDGENPNVSDKALTKLYVRLMEIFADHPDAYPVLDYVAFDETIKGAKNASILMINEDETVDVYDIKLSTDSKIDDGEITINGIKTATGYTHAPPKHTSSLKLKHTRELSLYAKMLENKGIKVNSLNVVPIQVTDMLKNQVTDIKSESIIGININPNVYTEVANVYTGEDSKSIIANLEDQRYKDVLDSIKTSLAERINKLMNSKGLNAKKRQANIYNLLKAFDQVSEVESIILFVDDAYKHLVTGRDDQEGIFSLFKKLKEDFVNGDLPANEAINRLVHFNTAANHFDLLDDIKALLGDTLTSELAEDDPLSKLNELIEVRNTIKSQFIDTVIPIVGDILYPYVDTQSAEKLENINQKEINRLEAKLKRLEGQTGPRANVTRRNIKKRLDGLTRITGVTNKEQFLAELKSVAKDHDLLDYYLSPIISSKDSLLSSFAKLVKDKLEQARRDTFSVRKTIGDALIEYKKKVGNKTPAKFNEGLYEKIKVLKKSKNEDGTYEIELVERMAFVQKADVSTFAQKEYDMFTKFNKLMATGNVKDKTEAWAIRNNFYRENYSSAKSKEEIHVIMKEKRDELISGLISQEVYDNYMVNNLYNKMWHARFEDGQITRREYIDKLIELASGVHARQVVKGPDFSEPTYGVNENYNKLVKDKLKFIYYKVLTEAYFTAQQLIPEFKRNGFILPSINKNSRDEFLESGPLKTVKNKFNQAFKSNEAEDIETLGVQDYGSGEDRILPILYSQDINPDEVSLDLASSVLKYVAAAKRYDMLNQVQSTATATLAVTKARKTPVTDSKGREMYNRFAKKVGVNKRIEKFGGNVAAAHLDAFIESIIYGKSNIKSEVDTPFGTIRLDKLADNLAYYSGLTQIGGNPILAVANSLQANIQTFIEAHGGEFFKKKDLLKADKIYMSSIVNGDFIKDFQKPYAESFLGQLIDIYDPLQGEYKDKFGRKVSHSTARKLMSTDSWFFMMHQGEHHIQVTTMLALMNNVKLKDANGNDITLYEAYTKDENGRVVFKDGITSPDGRSLEKVQMDMQNRLHALNKRMHGVYNDFDAPTIQRHWFGRLLIMYRKFIVPGVKRRYKKRGVDHELSGITEGYYNTFFGTMFREFDQMMNLMIPGREHNLDPYEVRNIRRAAFEMGMIISLSVFTMLLKDMDLDDEDYVGNFALYQSWRMLRELTFYVNPGSAMDILSQPFVAYSVLRKIQKLLIQIMPWHFFEEYERDAGVFKKGTNKAFARLMQLLGTNGYNTNPEYALQMLERFSSL